ncbi:MAG: hypothetical protein OHK005_19690 [Candidatus Methylacidiphilales bacterium]
MSKLRAIFLGLLALVTSQAVASEWVRLDGVLFDRKNFADGDSFHAKHQGKEYIFRLYWVDTPEPKAMGLTERTTQQARYFRIRKFELYEVAAAASAFSEKVLRHPFTVWTKWKDARGQSEQPRFYAVVRLAGGEDLADAVVKRGLARIYGEKSDHPDGRSHAQVIARLKELEAEAKKAKLGGWSYSR